MGYPSAPSTEGGNTTHSNTPTDDIAQGNVFSTQFHMCSVEVGGQQTMPIYRMLHHLPTYCSASQMFTDKVPNCQQLSAICYIDF